VANALQVIESAMGKLGLLGPGESASFEDADTCLRRLNAMVDAWEMEGILGYTTITTTFTLPANTQSRTIGPTMQINVSRPTHIVDSTFARIDNQDVLIKVVSQREYNQITLKSTDATGYWPEVLWYDGGIPTGNVYFWPLCSGDVEIHIVTPETGGIATLTTDYGFPVGYQRALEFNLAVEIAPDFNQVPSPSIMGAAANSKRLIRRRNSKVAQLDLDVYNGTSDIYSG
jgi:hypothetical protein